MTNTSQIADTSPSKAEPLGRVISVDGSAVTAMLSIYSQSSVDNSRITVGKFLGIRVGSALQIGVVTSISLQPSPEAQQKAAIPAAQLDLIGEIRPQASNTAEFRRAIQEYPAIGDKVVSIGTSELQLIFRESGACVIEVGTLQQALSMDAKVASYINVDNMLSKHFAIVGTTGVGKSSGLAHLIDRVVSVRRDVRVLVLDVHNEYGRCFGKNAHVLNSDNLRLPFWMFNFEEMVDVIFAGRPSSEEEVDLLAELIPLAKAGYSQFGGAGHRPGQREPEKMRYTVDVPVPYRIADLVSLLDNRMGKLENRSSRMVYNRLISRIETTCNDPRYAFMFENANVGGDTMEEVLSRLFRLQAGAAPISVVQLAGLPSEVLDAVVSVICRLAFDLGLWSDGGHPLLVVCEEAHRYMSADKRAGFEPTRRSLARIAKEGRKYNVFLGLVTQRPAELDATILAQCSTLFVMRLTNERDQELLRSAVSDTAANLLSLLPSLDTGEVFAFGEAVSVPSCFKFKQLPPFMLPRSEVSGDPDSGSVVSTKDSDLSAVIQRWRGLGRKPVNGEQPASIPHTQMLESSKPLDPEKFKLLKRPIDAASF